MQHHGDERADQRRDEHAQPAARVHRDHAAEREAGADEHERATTATGAIGGRQRGDEAEGEHARSRHGVSRTPGPASPPSGPNGAIRLARASIATRSGAAA